MSAPLWREMRAIPRHSALLPTDGYVAIPVSSHFKLFPREALRANISLFEWLLLGGGSRKGQTMSCLVALLDGSI